MDKDALTKAIIGTIGDIDGYQLPDAKGYTAFMRHVLGVTDGERQQRRDEILATSNKDFKCDPGFMAYLRPLQSNWMSARCQLLRGDVSWSFEINQ